MKHTFNNKRYKYLFILLLFLPQLAFVHAYLPVQEWFSNNPIFTDDYSLYYKFLLDKTDYIKEYGHLWAYDPCIRAGSITSAIIPIQFNGWFLFSFFLSFLPSEISFKLFFILALLAVPVFCYKAARNFDLSCQTAFFSALAGILLMHLSVMVNFLYWGSVSFVFGSYISILTLSFFYRYCASGQLKDLAFFILLLTAAGWIHAFTVVTLGVPLLLCYAVFFRRLTPGHHAGIFGSLFLAIAANMPWVYPFLMFLDHIEKDMCSFFYTTNNLMEPLKTYLFRKNLFNSYMNMVFHKEEWVDIFLTLSGMLGIYLWNKNKQREKAIIFLGSFCFFFLVSYYGSFFEITSITPMRFLIPLNIFLVFPSAVGLNYLYRFFLSDKPLKVKVISLVVLGYLLITLIAVPYYHLFYKKDFRLVSKVPEPFNQLVSWIKNNTNKEGRILIENSDFESGHQYYGTHLPYLLSRWTEREYIGNFFYYTPSLDSFTSYNAGYLFKKPIEGFTPRDLQSYLDLYNIKWIIYWSNASKNVFASGSKDFTYITRIDKFHICKAERKTNFFLKGTGSVKAETNKISLEGVTAVDGEVILGYHWMKCLKTDPPRRLERVLLKDDPIGFIKIKDTPSSIVIYNSYSPATRFNDM